MWEVHDTRNDVVMPVHSAGPESVVQRQKHSLLVGDDQMQLVGV